MVETKKLKSIQNKLQNARNKIAAGTKIHENWMKYYGNTSSISGNNASTISNNNAISISNNNASTISGNDSFTRNIVQSAIPTANQLSIRIPKSFSSLRTQKSPNLKNSAGRFLRTTAVSSFIPKNKVWSAWMPKKPSVTRKRKATRKHL
jgi:hypothetical protein